jgi:hypothetical protein
VKPPDYSKIKAKVKAVRRRSDIRPAMQLGCLPGAIGMALLFYFVWPSDPQKQVPGCLVLSCIVLGAVVCSAIFGYAAILAQLARRLIAGKKPQLPMPGNAAPACKSDAAITDVAEG